MTTIVYMMKCKLKQILCQTSRRTKIWLPLNFLISYFIFKTTSKNSTHFDWKLSYLFQKNRIKQRLLYPFILKIKVNIEYYLGPIDNFYFDCGKISLEVHLSDIMAGKIYLTVNLVGTIICIINWKVLIEDWSEQRQDNVFFNYMI
jgi:hypothetical protein